MHVDCYRKWEKVKDTSEVEREYVSEGCVPRRRERAAALPRRFWEGTGVTLAGRGSNFREHSNFKSSVGSVGRWAVGGGGCESPGGRWPGCGRDGEKRKQCEKEFTHI